LEPASSPAIGRAARPPSTTGLAEKSGDLVSVEVSESAESERDD